MDKKEAEAKIIAQLMNAVAILHEYDPKSDYLAMAYNGQEGFVNIHNEAFRADVRPVNAITDISSENDRFAFVKNWQKTGYTQGETVEVKNADLGLFNLTDFERAVKVADETFRAAMEGKDRKTQQVLTVVLATYKLALMAELTREADA